MENRLIVGALDSSSWKISDIVSGHLDTIDHEGLEKSVTPLEEVSSSLESLSDGEIDHKCKLLDDKDFLINLENILQKESLEYLDNQSQEIPLEENTIYSQNLNYNDSLLMKDFHGQPWDSKWNFAEKFKDPRLRFFAAKHIFRNFPETLPNRVFLHFHEKVSKRIFSLEKKSFLTLPGAMEEADTISLEIEENIDNKSLRAQLNQYNIYIDFLNDYYKQRNPKPIRFDSNLSKKLFG